MKQNEFGIKLAQLRKAKGLTQEDLAAECNINVRTLQRIEAGEVIPRSYTLKAILSALKIDYENFFSQLNSKREFLGNPNPKAKTGILKSITGNLSFALYIVLLLVFSFLIKFGMPLYFYIFPVLTIYLINSNEQEPETG